MLIKNKQIDKRAFGDLKPGDVFRLYNGLNDHMEVYIKSDDEIHTAVDLSNGTSLTIPDSAMVELIPDATLFI